MSPNDSNLAETKTMLVAMAQEATELKQAIGGPVTDAVADWLAAKYVVAVKEKLNGTTDTPGWEFSRAMVLDWTALRRGDHSAARLQLDREALDLHRANVQAQKEMEFWDWTERPDIHAKLFPNHTKGVSKETWDRVAKELKLL